MLLRVEASFFGHAEWDRVHSQPQVTRGVREGYGTLVLVRSIVEVMALAMGSQLLPSSAD